MKIARLLLFVFLSAGRAFAAEATPDETAKFLAGLPLRGTALEALGHDAAWVEHATEFDKAWRELDARQLAKIRAWAPEFLGDSYTSRGPLFYMFSGPDILYAHAFFPNAATYVLAGLEPVGAPPEVAHMPHAALTSALANLRKSLNSVLSFSFFITKEMKIDLRQNQLSGTVPILYIFLARSGCKIERTELTGLDKTGAITAGKSATPGVKITFTRGAGEPQTLYYFETNLANDGIKTNPGFLKFCEQLGNGRSFVKAASYLMHIGEFSSVRDFLLAHSAAILQDDSGIPLKNFEPEKWALRYFGSYSGPIETFKQYHQPELDHAYTASHPARLPFGFGYRWHPNQTSLMLAVPK